MVITAGGTTRSVMVPSLVEGCDGAEDRPLCSARGVYAEKFKSTRHYERCGSDDAHPADR